MANSLAATIDVLNGPDLHLVEISALIAVKPPVVDRPNRDIGGRELAGITHVKTKA